MTEQTASANLGKLAAKLVAATKNIGVVEKKGHNTKHDYKFVRATDVANEVRSALAEAGVAVIFDVESERMWEKQTANGGLMFFCSLSVRGTFVDSETGETISGRAIGWGSDSLDKAPYKAMTGALKYILRMNFLIPDEEDPEKDGAHENEKLVSSPRQTRTAAPAISPDYLYEDGVMDCQVLDVRYRAADPAKKKKEMVAVKVNAPVVANEMLFCFDKELFEDLKAIPKNGRAIFTIKESGNYRNIEGIREVNGKRFKDVDPLEITDEDTKFLDIPF